MLEPTYEGYGHDFETITLGIKDYKRTIGTSAGRVRLIYFNNLRWDGETLVELEKPHRLRDFSSFSKYRGFLESSIEKISKNMSSAGRQYPYQMIGTLSSGYDSPTVTVLALQSGLHDVISFTHARSGEVDHGKELANILGVQVSLVSRDAWNRHRFSEVPFIASDAKGEDVYFRGAEDKLRGRVLLTGFHGDKVWDKENKALNANIVRGDQSGLSLTEYRLWVGFIHLPVPFLGVRQIQEINAINHEAQMAYWDVGSDYNRPICRRIVEEAEVPEANLEFQRRLPLCCFANDEASYHLSRLKIIAVGFVAIQRHGQLRKRFHLT